MPLTFPSHAAAVLPLKRWRPAWFDGVALVIGSASPDLAYALDGSGLPVYPLSHQWPGLVLFCLPVTLLACVLVRWAAPGVAAHLPGRLTAYGILGCSRPPLLVTATSAIIGAASHLIWDSLAIGPFDLPSTAIGGAVALYFLLRYPPTTDTPTPHRAARAPVVFWPVAAAVAGAGIALAMRLPAAFLAHTTGARVLIALAAGMLAGAAVLRGLRGRPSEVA
ncbi:hypothetical protein Rhe02_56520 [Rhizocola hellebori]|uniref:DUF4184 family protein n=1 Tax=Rhizocola hellebori TaxID=1392758 RepID=A0A8J3VIG8_9ACTN|nr:DUF4184 family protein [Rhizocola hellebori]GIH07585.1 hypothetical protein Rhe02_56520 [Rhizocola hellebori]